MSSVLGSLSDAPYPGYSGSQALPSGRPGTGPLSPPLRQAGPAAAPQRPAAPMAAERPRLRDLRQGLAAAAKPARHDRFARWHVPESTEHESEGWLLPYLDLLTLLLALLVALLAVTRMQAGMQGPPAGDEAPAAVQLVGSVGSAGLPDIDISPLAAQDLPVVPAAWAALPRDDAPAPPSALPYTTEPAGPGMTARVPVPPGTSTAAAEPGIGGTDAAAHAAGPAAADAAALPSADAAALQASEASPAPAEPAAEPPSIAELGLDELGEAVDVIVNAQSISFRISNELLFPPGQAELGQAGREVLQRLADIVNRTDYRLSVEGHSDAVPIQTERFPSNWELSTARATSVLRQLERYGVASARLSATGYAHTRPIASNGSAIGRAANRRVELIMETGSPRPPAPLPASAAAQPAPQAATAR